MALLINRKIIICKIGNNKTLVPFHRKIDTYNYIIQARS